MVTENFSSGGSAPRLRYDALVKTLGEETARNLIAKVTQPPTVQPPTEPPISEAIDQPAKPTPNIETLPTALPVTLPIHTPQEDPYHTPSGYRPGDFVNYRIGENILEGTYTKPTTIEPVAPETKPEEEQELDDTKTLLQQDPDYMQITAELETEFLRDSGFSSDSSEYQEYVFGSKDPNVNAPTLDSDTEELFKEEYPEKYQHLLAAERERGYEHYFNDPVMKVLLAKMEQQISKRRKEEKTDPKIIRIEEIVKLHKNLVFNYPKKKYYGVHFYTGENLEIMDIIDNLPPTVLADTSDVSALAKELMAKLQAEKEEEKLQEERAQYSAGGAVVSDQLLTSEESLIKTPKPSDDFQELSSLLEQTKPEQPPSPESQEAFSTLSSLISQASKALKDLTEE